MNVDAKTFEIIETEREKSEFNLESHKQTPKTCAANLSLEMEHSEDKEGAEQGKKNFIEYLQSGKLEIKAHPS